MANFTVIGLGTFGYFVARFLANRGCNVLGIDIDERQVDRIKAHVEKAIIADATNKEILEQLGLQDMDAVIVSMGNKIDASVLITLYLKELKVKQILVKAVTEDHGKILNVVGATDIVFPERDVALKVSELLVNPNILDTLSLGPDYSIVELAPPLQFLHKSLRDLDIRNKHNIQILAIKEIIPDNLIVMPDANYVIKDSDILLVIGKIADIEKIKRNKS